MNNKKIFTLGICILLICITFSTVQASFTNNIFENTETPETKHINQNTWSKLVFKGDFGAAFYKDGLKKSYIQLGPSPLYGPCLFVKVIGNCHRLQLYEKPDWERDPLADYDLEIDEEHIAISFIYLRGSIFDFEDDEYFIVEAKALSTHPIAGLMCSITI